MIVEVRLAPDQLQMLGTIIAQHMGGVKDAYTVKEFAKKLGVDPKTIHRRIKAGLIHKAPNMGAVRIPASELERLLNDPGRSKG